MRPGVRPPQGPKTWQSPSPQPPTSSFKCITPPTATPARTSLSAAWFFFFSSRRRHTRFDCDWSSDVCSSDLTLRTPEQTQIGIFWAYDGTPSLCAPPRLYNQIVAQIADQMDTEAVELARLMADRKSVV